MNKKIISAIVLTVIVVAVSIFFVSSSKKTLPAGFEIKSDGVYYHSELLAGVDPKTVQYIGDGYIKDSKNVYNAYGAGLPVKGADVNTFVTLSNAYEKDINNVYYLSIIVDGADPKTFQVIGGFYAKDTKNVYELNRIIAGADLKTAVLLWSNPKVSQNEYLKDKDSVYLDWVKIQNADPATFTYIGNGYSKDKNSVYFAGDGMGPISYSIVQGSDLATIVPVVGTDYAKDKNHVYYYGKQTGANPENCTTENVAGCAK
ncbi:MAG: DKNYY domain-containing protein [Candidatus Paceibacteria bacterium]